MLAKVEVSAFVTTIGEDLTVEFMIILVYVTQLVLHQSALDQRQMTVYHVLQMLPSTAIGSAFVTLIGLVKIAQ